MKQTKFFKITSILCAALFGALLAVVGVSLVMSVPTMFLWNWFMPSTCGLKTITIWQAFGIQLFARILLTRTPPAQQNGGIDSLSLKLARAALASPVDLSISKPDGPRTVEEAVDRLITSAKARRESSQL